MPALPACFACLLCLKSFHFLIFFLECFFFSFFVLTVALPGRLEFIFDNSGARKSQYIHTYSIPDGTYVYESK
jgi:hypothetical protein